MARCVAAIDQGTTSTRCILFDENARVIAVDQAEHRQIFPAPGLVEHDPVGPEDHAEPGVVRGAFEHVAGAGVHVGEILSVPNSDLHKDLKVRLVIVLLIC